MHRALIALLVLAACSGPPANHDSDFDWQVEVSGLGEAVLSVCGGGDAVYAVGGDGDRALVLEWTGSEWRAPVLPGSARVLWWCWVDADDQVWAVGERGTVLRRSGGRWQSIDTTGAIDPAHTLYGVWGTGDTVFVVGGSLSAPSDVVTLARYSGGGFTAADTTGVPDQPLFKVWGSAADDVWAVGTGGVILHHDGQTWAAVDSPTTERLIAVWGTGPDEAYAVGGDAIGLVLAWDGQAWTELVRPPERLSGLHVEPGGPLYVGGDRGFLGRYQRGPDGAIAAALATQVVVRSDLCVHALHGGPGFVAAAASDLVGGGPGRWQGAVLSHGDRLAGDLVREPAPDAGVPADAGPDATITDGGVDAAPLPGPGEACGAPPDFCAPGLECWQLLTSGTFICTESCESAATCGAYGAGACCARPGFQTLETVCIPGQYAECQQ